MLKNIFEKQKTKERGKCIKCKDREATNEDQMCDSCRFLLTIEDILKDRQ